MKRAHYVGLGALLSVLLLVPEAFGGNVALTRIITRDTGGGATNASSGGLSLSGNGRFVAFRSLASDLVPNDTVDGDVFVHDGMSNQIERVSVRSDGSEQMGIVGATAITPDGRYVVFDTAKALIAGDTNGTSDIYLRDRDTDKTKRISVNSAEQPQQGGSSTSPDISDDGRFVVFTSSATNLVGQDTNGVLDVFVRDRQLGTTRRVSVSSDETQAEGGISHGAKISGNGRKVAFTSDSDDLVEGDIGNTDVFVRNLPKGTTVQVDENNLGNQAIGGAQGPAISRNGRYVAFYSDASNLVGDDDADHMDVFLRDLKYKRTTRVSVDSIGNEGDEDSSGDVCLSASGRYVTFTSTADNLTPLPGNANVAGIFRHDTHTGQTIEVSINTTGNPAHGDSGCISADGQWVAFESDADDLDNDQPASTFRNIFLRGPIP